MRIRKAYCYIMLYVALLACLACLAGCRTSRGAQALTETTHETVQAYMRDTAEVEKWVIKAAEGSDTTNVSIQLDYDSCGRLKTLTQTKIRRTKSTEKKADSCHITSKGIITQGKQIEKQQKTTTQPSEASASREASIRGKVFRIAETATTIAFIILFIVAIAVSKKSHIDRVSE